MRIRNLTLLSITILLVSCTMPSNDQKYDFDQVSTFAAQTVAAGGNAQTEQTPEPETTPTPQLTSGTPSDPTCNVAAFVADVTIPDDTVMFIEKPFTKIWRLKNIGTCAWTPEYKLVFDSDTRMSAAPTQPLTNISIAPGESVEISVDLIAPAVAGTFRSSWKIQAPSGETFALSSGPFWVQIKTKRGSIIAWKELQQGANGAEVYAIQSLLDHYDLTTLVDGVFGADTKKQIKIFQKRKGLEETGMVDPETWETIVVQVAKGSNGKTVNAVQYLLKTKFGYELEIDGIFGPLTEDAIKDFQSKQGLTENGTVDILTWQKLIGK